MDCTPSQHRALGVPRRPIIAATVALALAGGLALGWPSPSLYAQLKPESSLEAPFGRAPLSFADIVDRVKPAVVSIHVTNGGDKVAAKGGKGFNPKEFLPDLPDDHPLSEFFKNLPKEWRGLPTPTPRPPG